MYPTHHPEEHAMPNPADPTTLAAHPERIDGIYHGAPGRLLMFESFEDAAHYADTSGLGIHAVQQASTGWAVSVEARSLDAVLIAILDREGTAAA